MSETTRDPWDYSGCVWSSQSFFQVAIKTLKIQAWTVTLTLNAAMPVKPVIYQLNHDAKWELIEFFLATTKVDLQHY